MLQLFDSSEEDRMLQLCCYMIYEVTAVHWMLTAM